MQSMTSKKKMQLPKWLEALSEKETNMLETHMQLLRSKMV
jgi:hypothetical protein